MNRRLEMVLSSIGKKEIMALTGLGFVGFLIVHLAGNFTLLWGKDAFDGYAEKLESLGPLIWAAEAGMVAMAAFHVATGLLLIYRNWVARGQRYAVKRFEGGQTWGSWSMRLTGPWILMFVVVHLLDFTLPHKLFGETDKLSQMVSTKFSNPVWAGFYIVSAIIVGLHMSHGIWSAFQSLGVSQSRKGLLRDAASVVGIIVGLGFTSLAAFVLVNHYMQQ
ncbi:MAG: succinate dehydrogenase cytochrome b subunit [Polyangiaceae bacterium]|nr:succinate dehydrogenase cytochrome b subunit [Polyangiaceae bacterium]